MESVDKTVRRVARAAAPLLSLCLWMGCSSSKSGNDVPGGNGGESDGSIQCDDGKSCTIDAVVNGSCIHSVGPNRGDTACPNGQFCTLKGCVAAPACATRADCQRAWADDPCKTQPACDAASSVCVFEILDKDKDGHAPVVCGGDDCDDGDASRAPGQDEVCDGVDNDCDGEVDNGASCGDLQTCEQGACVCKPENLCGSKCVDQQTDAKHCGACGNACGPRAKCVDGACGCPDGLSTCPGMDGCVNLTNDDANCGDCGKTCDVDASCVDGACVCADGYVDCRGTCADIKSDPDNCGDCGVPCADATNETATCTKGSCVRTCAPGYAHCDGGADAGCTTEVASDAANCGACGRDCAGKACAAGFCESTVVAIGLTFPADAVVDTVNVYWTDLTLVQSVPKVGGTAVTRATGTGAPNYIVVDATNIYWTEELNSSTNIVRLAKSGNATPAILTTVSGNVSGLAVVGSNLYFSLRLDGAVMKLPVGGGDAMKIATGKYIMALASDGTDLFWTDRTTPYGPGGGTQDAVFSLPNGAGSPVELGIGTHLGRLVGAGSRVYIIDEWGDRNLLAVNKDGSGGLKNLMTGKVFSVQGDGTTAYWAAVQPGTTSGVWKQSEAGPLQIADAGTRRVVADDKDVYYFEDDPVGTETLKKVPK